MLSVTVFSWWQIFYLLNLDQKKYIYKETIKSMFKSEVNDGCGSLRTGPGVPENEIS